MRREALLVLLLWASGASAADPPPKPAGPVSISDALCGRGGDFPAKRARALEDFAAVPALWRDVEVKNLQPWLEAPICPAASEWEEMRYRSRHRVLVQIDRRLERAQALEQMGPALAPFRGWRQSSEEWPGAKECQGCEELRSSAACVADVAARWPSRKSTRIGPLLGDAARREPLVDQLCAAKPSSGAREEIENRFRYYSWTAAGARLFEVKALFEKPEIVDGCRAR